MLATYVFLFAAFFLLYVPTIPVGSHYRLHPWQMSFAAALAAGIVVGLLRWPAALGLCTLWLVASAASRAQTPIHSARWRLLAITIAVALALHLVPGFGLFVIAHEIRLTPESAPMTLKANFDQGASGLLLLAYFCPRPTISEWPRVIMTGVAYGTAAALTAIGLVFAVGAVSMAPKLPLLAAYWVPINLLLTCVFEEVLFRRFIQGALAEALRDRPQWRWVPLASSSVLFGLAHAGGGSLLVVAASLAGVGYGLAYARTSRIEAAVLAHFVLNAIHFFLFTYPYAAR